MKILPKVVIFALTSSVCFGFFGYQDFDYKLCGGYSLMRRSAHQVDIVPQEHNDRTPIIPEKVIEVAWDTRFILAKRQEVKKDHEPVPDQFDFWILDTKKPVVYGPLKKDDFDKKRKKLGIPDSLVLKDIYEYAPKPRQIKLP